MVGHDRSFSASDLYAEFMLATDAIGWKRLQNRLAASLTRSAIHANLYAGDTKHLDEPGRNVSRASPSPLSGAFAGPRACTGRIQFSPCARRRPGSARGAAPGQCRGSGLDGDSAQGSAAHRPVPGVLGLNRRRVAVDVLAVDAPFGDWP